MNPELLREYAELKIKEKQVKSRIEEIGPVIKNELVSSGMDKLPTNLGNFSIKKIKRWTYSLAVNLAKDRLDKLKAEEEAAGVATFVEVDQLEFRENKNGSR